MSTVCTGPLSEIGDLRDPTEDTHSIYGDSDLMSSDGREQVNIYIRLPAISARMWTMLARRLMGRYGPLLHSQAVHMYCSMRTGLLLHLMRCLSHSPSLASPGLKRGSKHNGWPGEC